MRILRHCRSGLRVPAELRVRQEKSLMDRQIEFQQSAIRTEEARIKDIQKAIQKYAEGLKEQQSRLSKIAAIYGMDPTSKMEGFGNPVGGSRGRGSLVYDKERKRLLKEVHVDFMKHSKNPPPDWGAYILENERGG